MSGYDRNFLGVDLPLPRFSPALVGDVLRDDALATDEDGLTALAHYPHYTVAMNHRERTAIYAALNIDQNNFHISDSGKWRIDTRIGADFQLNNDYYRDSTHGHNPWDRGHLARRASAAWGLTGREAQQASEETYYYSNSALQHKNFNRDEWVALEDWVKHLDIDEDGKISVFSGPIYGEFARSITPAGRQRAIIPSAFFKVVAFMAAGGALEVRSFIVVQDEDAIRDKGGRAIITSENAAAAASPEGARDMLAFQRYQVTVSEIESRTGLIFPDAIPAQNPLFFSMSHVGADARRISHLPERVEVDAPADLVNAADEERIPVLDEVVPVFMAAAMVSPKGKDKDGEWISLINLGPEDQPLDGWTISDTRRQPYALDGLVIPAGGGLRVGPPLKAMQLSNTGGTIALLDDQQRRIDRVKYQKDEVTRGVPVIFARPIAASRSEA